MAEEPPRLWRLWYSPKMHAALRASDGNVAVFPDGRIATALTEDGPHSMGWDDVRSVGTYRGRGGSWKMVPPWTVLLMAR